MVGLLRKQTLGSNTDGSEMSVYQKGHVIFRCLEGCFLKIMANILICSIFKLFLFLIVGTHVHSYGGVYACECRCLPRSEMLESLGLE